MTSTGNGVAASRNGQHAKGPRSPAGKAKSSPNATKHGIRSECPVIPEVESIDEWEAHRDAIVDDLDPEGAIETSLAEEFASIKWKLGRVDRFEREQTSKAIRQAADLKLNVLENRTESTVGPIEADFLERVRKVQETQAENDPLLRGMLRDMVAVSVAPTCVQNLVIRYRAALKRDLRQTLADLTSRQAKRSKSEVKQMEEVLDTVMGPNHHKDIVLTQDEYRELIGEAEENAPEPDESPSAEPAQQATVVMSAAELSSFGNKDATPTPVKVSEPLKPAPASSAKGVDKHGFALELTRAHRRKLWKDKVQKQKEEKRRKTTGNLTSNGPTANASKVQHSS